MRTAFLACLAVLLAGCGGPAPAGTGSPAYSTSSQVRDALERSGLACADYVQLGREHRGIGEEGAVDVGSCTLGTEPVSIAIWRDEGEKKDWADLDERVGCELANSLGTPPIVYVDGGTWTVSPTSRALADSIARAIGGIAVKADCRPAALQPS